MLLACSHCWLRLEPGCWGFILDLWAEGERTQSGLPKHTLRISSDKAVPTQKTGQFPLPVDSRQETRYADRYRYFQYVSFAPPLDIVYRRVMGPGWRLQETGAPLTAGGSFVVGPRP